MSALDEYIKNNKQREENAKQREKTMLKLENNDIMANVALMQILMYLTQKISNKYKEDLEKKEEMRDILNVIKEKMSERKDMTLEYFNSDEFTQDLKNVDSKLSDEKIAEFKEQIKEVVKNDEAELNLAFIFKDREVEKNKETQKERQSEHNRHRQNSNRQR